MSRCFPYPPPGYERKSGALDETLINSIKLQKESEKAKKERRKEKKREKKEKEREREKSYVGVEDKKQKHEKRHKNEKGKVEHEVGDHLKRPEVEAELLEKSGLTEEHCQPVSSQNSYDTSDSVQNNHKRKRQNSSSDLSHNNHGGIFRIRLKQKDPELLPNKELSHPNSSRTHHILQEKCEIPPRLDEEKQCSTSGRQQQFSMSGRIPVRQETLKLEDQEIPSTIKSARSNILGKTGPNSQGKYETSLKISEVQHCLTSGKTTNVQEKYENDPRMSEEQTCSTSGRTVVQAPEIVKRDHKSGKKLKKVESLYRDLIENWVPPPIENYGTNFDDQEWLFQTQSKDSKLDREPKRFEPTNDGVCQGSTSIWPRACYLPEADVYALPYTVPF